VSRGIVLLLCLLGACARAAELSPVIQDGMLGVRVDGLIFPDTLTDELQSGLTNRLYLSVTLLDGGAAIRQHAAEIAIRYDLWDEVFLIARTVDNAAAESQRLDGPAEVRGLLSALRIPKVFGAAELPRGRELTLRVEVLLNPIRREKLRMIRQWVAENSTPDPGSDRGPTTSSAIFNRIFSQYADGSDIAAQWRAELTSPPFRADAVHEGR
jgi:hypothetical protein